MHHGFLILRIRIDEYQHRVYHVGSYEIVFALNKRSSHSARLAATGANLEIH